MTLKVFRGRVNLLLNNLPQLNVLVFIVDHHQGFDMM